VLCSESVRRLGDLVSVDIGYVTGAHDFFHLSRQGIQNWEIPREFCVRSLRNGRGVKGSVFERRDWDSLRNTGATCYLFKVPPRIDRRRFRQIRPYLAEGIRRGVDRRYQCRIRDPWYSVKSVRVPDAFITSMSAAFPRLIVNCANVTGSNSLHLVTRHPGIDQTIFRAVAASWYCSFTIASTILEGHELGGGLRKLEPSDAESVSVLVPLNLQAAEKIGRLLPDVDRSLRKSDYVEASRILDDALLMDFGGLTTREADELAGYVQKTMQQPRRRRLFTAVSPPMA